MKKMYLIAAIAALLCGFFVYRFFSEQQQPSVAAEPEPLAMETVVMAATDIPALTEITAEMLTYSDYPADYVPEDAVRNMEDILGLQSDGRIKTGEILLGSKLGTPEEISATLSEEIPEGMRALTISTDTISGVAGYICKGDYVDLLMYVDGESTVYENEDGESYTVTESGSTKVLLEAVKVLAVGELNYSTDNGVYSNLTFLLTPEQCEQIVAARNNGSIILTLRRTGDNGQSE